MRQLWFSRRAIGLHVVIIIVVPTFALLCNWQVHRALDGNELSWAYVFEWPFFAGYAVYMWWRFLHEDSANVANPGDVAMARQLPRDAATPTPTSTSIPAPLATPAPADPLDEERSAYNQYLADLAAQDKRKQWR